MQRLRTTISEDLSEVHGTCSLCGRKFRVFARRSLQDAVQLLRRSFKTHCRQRHNLLVKELPEGYGVEQMVEELGLPAYICRRNSRELIAANQQFRHVMGYTDSEAKSLRLDDLRAPAEVPLLLQSLLQNIGEGTVERHYQTRDGRPIRVRLRYRDLTLVQNHTEISDACIVVLTRCDAA